MIYLKTYEELKTINFSDLKDDWDAFSSEKEKNKRRYIENLKDKFQKMENNLKDEELSKEQKEYLEILKKEAHNKEETDNRDTYGEGPKFTEYFYYKDDLVL